MQLLPGTIEIDKNPEELLIWKQLVGQFNNNINGYLAYKIPVLGTTSPENVPTFLLVDPAIGIYLIDVVGYEVSHVIDESSWSTAQDEPVESRDVILEHYIDEITTRLKRSKNLYSRKDKSPRVPIHSVIIFHENTHEQIKEIFKNEEEYFVSD